MPYAIFSSYYKYGEVGIRLIESDEEMMAYCLKEAIDYLDGDDDLESMVEEYEGYSLEKLIIEVIRQGNDLVDRQLGWGIRYIVKGDNLSAWQ